MSIKYQFFNHRIYRIYSLHLLVLTIISCKLKYIRHAHFYYKYDNTRKSCKSLYYAPQQHEREASNLDCNYQFIWYHQMWELVIGALKHFFHLLDAIIMLYDLYVEFVNTLHILQLWKTVASIITNQHMVLNNLYIFLIMTVKTCKSVENIIRFLL